MKLKIIFAFLISFSIHLSATDFKINRLIKVKYNAGTVYFIGWSSSGNMAYLNYYDVCNDKERKHTVCDITIQSMKTDSLIETFSFESEQYQGKIDTLVSRRDKDIQQILNKYRIFCFYGFIDTSQSITMSNIDYSIDFISLRKKCKVYYKEAGNNSMENLVNKAVLSISSQPYGSLNLLYYNKKETDNILNIEYKGCLKSPFEQRLTFLILQHPLFENDRTKVIFRGYYPGKK